MDPNPYQSPKAKLAQNTDRELTRDGACPECYKPLTNWTVINVARRYKCPDCGAVLSIMILNPIAWFVDRSIWILMLRPLIIKLAGFDMAMIDWSIVAPLICLAVWFVTRLAYGTISMKPKSAG